MKALFAAQTLPTPSVEWGSLVPELILLGASLFLLLVAALAPDALGRAISWTVGGLAFAASAVAAIVTWDNSGGDRLALSGQLHIDHLTNFARVLVACVGLAVVLLSVGERALAPRVPEYVLLVLMAAAGMDLLAASNSFVTLFVALELFSITLYILCAIERDEARGLEAALKYLILGSVGSALIVFGSAFLYGATKSFRFEDVERSLAAGGATGYLPLAGTAFLIAGLSFKVSAVPFHQWTPDVYEGAPTPITAFMGAATKVAAFTVMLRVLVQAVGPQANEWRPAVAGIAIASMVVGNVAALAQRDLKRMLAYSSVGHAGYLLIGVVAAGTVSGHDLGVKSVLFYLAVYSAMTIGAFGAVAALERRLGEPATLDSVRGSGYDQRLPVAVLVFCLLSFGGFPPTGGFLAKLYVFGAAVDGGYTYLAIVGAVTTVISLGYYLRVGFAFYARPGVPDIEVQTRPKLPAAVPVVAALAASALIVLWLGVYPPDVLDWAGQAAGLAASR
jgi:NADH-quinone oxidoreductase subunit N